MVLVILVRRAETCPVSHHVVDEDHVQCGVIRKIWAMVCIPCSFI